MQTSRPIGWLYPRARVALVVISLVACRVVPKVVLGPPAFAAAGVVVALAPAHIEVGRPVCDGADKAALAREIDEAASSALTSQGFSVTRDVHQPHDLTVAPQMVLEMCDIFSAKVYDPQLTLEVSENGAIIERVVAPLEADGSSDYVARLRLAVAMMQRSAPVARVVTHEALAAEASPPAATTPGRASTGQSDLAVHHSMRLLVLPLKPVSGTTAATCKLLTSYMLSQLDQVKQMRTVGQEDIEQALGVDKQRQALGCDALSCMAEIGGALGVDYVMYGEIGALGSKYNVNVSVVRTGDASVAARWSGLVEKTEDALAAQVPVLVEQVVARLNEQ